MKHTEIAAAMKMTPQQVKHIENTAISKLMKLLKSPRKAVVAALKDLYGFQRQAKNKARVKCSCC